MLRFLLVICMMVSPLFASPNTQAPFALIKDANSGAIFFQKDADQMLFPSSMTKIMTAYIVFQRLHNQQLQLNDRFIISERAWKTKGSSMFLNVGESVSVRDLLLGALVQSGNDACIVLAEGIGGSEESFVSEMNKLAKEMGCTGTQFANCTGLPAEEHYTTANDLYLMALRTLQDFPELYKEFYAIPEYTFNNISQSNLNPLIGKGLGVDGFKTGHTDAAGYGVTISAEQKGHRVIIVVNGLKSKKERAEESLSLVNWVFSQYRTFKIAGKKVVIDHAPVWLGGQEQVGLVTHQDVYFSIAKADIQNMKVEIHIKSPVAAPITKGQKLGDLVVKGSGVQADLKIPLHAAESVDTIGFVGRIQAAFQYLWFGHLRPQDSTSSSGKS